MVTSYQERRPAEPDELDERGRSAAAASTAGAVTSSVVVTIERLARGLRADGVYAWGGTTDGAGVGVGCGAGGRLDGGGAAGGGGGGGVGPR
ncbi:hypothetical protein ACH4OW_12335 [Streptomyces sp. NPDC017056]|uniref:hypothetical protein n=1 Tax=Streptomyces sp. NPDC017056 TaxID=3364973 RepID=UPI003799A9B9